MWANVDPATKERLEAEYQKNKIEAAREKEEYEAQYGKIERKKKKKHDKKDKDDEWSRINIFLKISNTPPQQLFNKIQIN